MNSVPRSPRPGHCPRHENVAKCRKSAWQLTTFFKIKFVQITLSKIIEIYVIAVQ